MNEKEKKSEIFIALIDDEGGILEIYEEILSSIAQVMCFKDPKLFIEHFEQPNPKIPDLIIMDFNMPKMNGVDMIRTIFKKGVRFPVILLSGYLDKDTAIKAVDIGVYKLLEKPSDERVIMASVEQILIENEIYSTQQEVQKMINKLKEYYKGFREALSFHLPQEVLEKLLVETYSDGSIKRNVDIDKELEQIEKKLETLIESEKTLRDIKYSKVGILK